MKKILSLLSVVTITGTSLPTVTAASNYENQNTETKIKNYYEIGIKNLENELNNCHKLKNEIQKEKDYYEQNKNYFISKYGEEWFNKKLKMFNKYIDTYMNNITGLTNELERIKELNKI